MKREENIENVMRGFAEALVNGETERAVSFFAEDAVWYTPNGRFSGKDEIHNYIEWIKETIRDEQITGTGIDIIVKDDVGIYEHIIGGKSKGRPWKTMALCVYIVEAENDLNRIHDSFHRGEITGDEWADQTMRVISRRQERYEFEMFCWFFRFLFGVLRDLFITKILRRPLFDHLLPGSEDGQ